MLSKEDKEEVESMLRAVSSVGVRTSKRLDNLIKILVKKDIITKANAARLRSY